VSGAVVLSGAGAAWAQTPYNSNVDVQQFRPAPGPNNFLTVEGARVDGHLAWSVSAFANYSYQPMVLYDAVCPNDNGTPDPGNCTPGPIRSVPLQHLFTLNILGTLTLANRVQIGLDIPLSIGNGDVIVMTPDENYGRRTTPPQTFTGFSVADPRLEVKVRILGEGQNGPAFAAAVFGQFPIGRYIAPNQFLGDSAFLVGGRLIGEFRRNRFAIAANVGIAVRAQEQANQVLSSFVGSRLTWGLAASYDITPRVGVLAEFYGSTDLYKP